MPAAKLPKAPPRIDPKPRHIDGSAIWARLKNRDETKHYVFVNKGDLDALAYYEYAGYEPELLREGGVCPAGGKTVKVGQHIEVRGLLLYSIDKREFQRIELEGVDGDSGQARIDKMEADILDKRGYDPLRGIGRGLVSLVNEIEPTKNEVAIP